MRHGSRYFGYESIVYTVLAAVTTVTFLMIAHALLNSTIVA